MNFYKTEDPHRHSLAMLFSRGRGIPKNSGLYRTENSDRVGDMYVSLVYIWELRQANPFDNLTAATRRRAIANPEPWIYRNPITAEQTTA